MMPMASKRFLIILHLLAQVLTLLSRADEERLTFHKAANPLPANAKTEAWPKFLGPRDDAVSLETGVAMQWPDAGPPLVWEVEKGEGYTTPAMVAGKLVLFHRYEGRETIECREAETGKELWSTDYPVEYRDRFGYSNGPRGSPVIHDSLVYTLGVKSMLTCLALATGKQVWQRDLMAEFAVPQNFFGTGSSPIIHGNKLLVNVGGKEAGGNDRETVVAFDRKTGETVWIARSAWGASYASPVLATIHGKERLFVFAGGRSKPTVGGLMMLDPEDGRILDQFPWRASKVESVNATTPVVHGNRVFITETYRKGGVCLEVDAATEKLKPVWKAPNLAIHWCRPVFHDGLIYGFHGEREPAAELVCHDWQTGEEKWRNDLRWNESINGRTMINSVFRGSLLKIQDQYLCLGEGGALLWLRLSDTACKPLQRTQLFHATQTWSVPAIHRGLVYISQHYKDLRGQTGPRLLCYDFRETKSPSGTP